MARQAITLAGAFVGAAFGSPQLGFAIGSIVGGLVDPQVIKAPSIGDIAQQTSAEGVPCPLYAGTAGGAGNLIYASEPDIVDGGTEGKGGPQQELPDRAYVTFIVRIGASLFDGPGHRHGITGLIKVWEDEKLVYDVSPTSEILAESAEYAKGFSFYPGNETQMPDPDVEAIEGVGNVSAYRGRAIFVKKRHDVTDRRGSLPMYRFEVTVDGQLVQEVSLVTNDAAYSGSPQDLTRASGAIGWTSNINLVRVSPDGIYAIGSEVQATVSNRFQIKKYNRSTGLWDSLALPSFVPLRGPSGIAWSPDGLTLAISTITPDEPVILYRRSGDNFTKLADPVDPIPPPAGGTTALSWDQNGVRLAAGAGSTGAGMYVYDFVGDALVNRKGFIGTGTGVVGRPNYVDFIPVSGGRYIACGSNIATYVTRCDGPNLEVCAQTTDDARNGISFDPSGDYVTAVNLQDIRVFAFDGTSGAESLTVLSTSSVAPTTTADFSFTKNRRYLAVARSGTVTVYDLGGSGQPTPVLVETASTPGNLVGSVSWVFGVGVPQIQPGSTTFEQVTLAAGRRCKIPDSAWNLPGLDAKVIRGSVVASQNYTAQDYVNSLRVVIPSDGACYDGLIHINLRGGGIDQTLDEEFMVDAQDDGEQDETLRNADDKRKAPIRRPYKINLMFPNAKVGYTLTKATSPNYGDRGDAVSETTLEVPVVLDEETEAPQLADILDKIGRAEAEGELVRIFPEGEAAKLVPGSIVRLVSGDLTRRLRVQNDRHGDGTVRLHMFLDRLHAYGSQATSQPGQSWPTPPPSIPGLTTFVPMNLPVLTDEQDLLGFQFAISGQPGTAWHGARIDYRVAGSTDWISLGNFTRRAVIGTLLAPVASASPFFTDTTNEVRVALTGDDELLSITETQLLNERNPFALVYTDGTAEIGQYQDAQDDGNREWTLSTLLRGRLNTEAGPHLAGARFVQLAGSQFVQLPSALIGADLQFRVTSLGSSPETAPIFPFTWNPVLSQTEFPPANLLLDRSGDTVTALAVPRHRLGTEINPLPANRWTGYRFTATDGSNTATVSTDTLTPTADFDVNGWASPVTVTAALVNDFTGAGPSISEDIA